MEQTKKQIQEQKTKLNGVMDSMTKVHMQKMQVPLLQIKVFGDVLENVLGLTKIRRSREQEKVSLKKKQ